MFKYKYFLVALAFITLCILRFVLLENGSGTAYAVTFI